MPSLATYGIIQYKDKLFKQIQPQLLEAILNEITKDRNQESTNYDLLKQCI